MKNTISMYAVVPVKYANDLRDQKRIADFNSLPQINPAILNGVRQYMAKNVGFSDLPMACLSLNARSAEMNSSELFEVLPINSKDSVLFQLQMPEDMIVSIDYDALLELSNDALTFSEPEDIDCLIEDLNDQLVVGSEGLADKDDKQIISFIPFLDYNYCKLYARFDEHFNVKEMEMPGLDKFPMAKLSAFIN